TGRETSHLFRVSACSVILFARLEQILQRELNLPLRACAGVGRGSDRTEGRTGKALHREEEVGMIGQVEDLGAELELMAFGDAEETRNAQVEVVQPIAAQNVSARVAERSGGVLFPSRCLARLAIAGRPVCQSRARIEPAVGAGIRYAYIADDVR